MPHTVTRRTVAKLAYAAPVVALTMPLHRANAAVVPGSPPCAQTCGAGFCLAIGVCTDAGECCYPPAHPLAGCRAPADLPLCD